MLLATLKSVRPGGAEPAYIIASVVNEAAAPIWSRL